ncbi:GLPGLI family protein, partial [Porphyromonas gingivalis]|uniref:GLPGLI family protein n=1 Tax=Porphyromonas gingivalis TaxID=837 RepID=UPI0027B9E708
MKLILIKKQDARNKSVLFMLSVLFVFILSPRDCTAWYAEDIALSDGPYIFRGLPGLIVAIGSDDGEYVFELNGMQ